MNVKMLFTDLDGTLLNSNDNISDKNLAAIQKLKENGIKVAIATGRAKVFSDYVIDKIRPDYYIGLNGAVTMDVNSNEYINKIFLKHKTANDVLDMLDEMNLFYLVCTHGKVYFPRYFEGNLKEGVRDLFLKRFKDAFEPIINRDDMFDQKPATFFVETKNDKNTDILLSKLRNIPEITPAATRKYGYDLIPVGVNKATAISYLCKQIGINTKDVIAVGDSENDISMLKAVGKGVAVGNAFDHVKDIADLVVSSNDNDGVAHLVDLILDGHI